MASPEGKIERGGIVTYFSVLNVQAPQGDLAQRPTGQRELPKAAKMPVSGEVSEKEKDPAGQY